MKWTWDKFGYSVPSEPSPNPELILATLNLESEPSARVQFFPDLGRAVVTTNELKTLARSDLIRASSKSNWDVEYYAENDLKELKRLAVVELTRIQFINLESATVLIHNGIFCLDDVSVLSLNRLTELLNVEATIANSIIESADELLSTDEDVK